ncbi:hypothetical protein [Heyndrickxia ginsengihumi]|uniref:hypothetical protein n=1 Tax=Heyndrickxia ginsengihumi TaxID=363870 RepID=UPI003D1FCF3A
MVRYNGFIMTEIKYNEIQQEAEIRDRENSRSLMQRLNLFFFDLEKISVTDWIWFYGLMIFEILLTITVVVISYT